MALVKTARPSPEARPASAEGLFAPVPGDAGAHGAFDRRARRFSAQLWLNRRRAWLAAGAAGVVLVVAPWLLGYPQMAAVNSVAAGALLVVFGAVRGRMSQRFGSGWSAVPLNHA